MQKPLLVLFIISFCFIGIILGINVPAAVFLLLAFLCYLISFRINLKGFAFILFGLAFVVRFGYILCINTPPESDFKLLYDAAVSFSQGDYSFNQLPYFKDWAYQTGFVVYEGSIIRLIGIESAQLVLKLLNTLFSSGTCLLIYLISRNFVSEKVSRFGSLLSVWAVFPVTFVSVLSNQHIATFFLVLGLFIFTDKNWLRLSNALRGLFAGLSLAIGNIMRPEGVIFICALLVFFLVSFLKPGEERRKGLVINASLLLLIYLGAHAAVSQAIIDQGINIEGLRNNNPLWKFVVGLNYDTAGSMSHEDSDLVYGEYNYTNEERNDIELSLIKNRLNAGSKALLPLFIAKQQALWGGDPLIWSYGYLITSNEPVKLLSYDVPIEYAIVTVRGIHNLQMFILVFLSLIGSIYLFKVKINQHLMVYYYILLISVAIYSIVEVQPRYIYLQQAVLFVTAMIGTEALIKRLSAWIKASGAYQV